MRILSTLLCFTLCVGALFAQGTGDGLELTTATGLNTPDNSHKNVAWNDVLTIRMDDMGANVVGQPVLLAAELLDWNPPLGFPCFDLDGDPSTCEANVTGNLFYLVAPTAGLFTGLPGSGLQIGVPLPPDANFWAAPNNESVRVQGATANPASPIGVSVTNFVDHHVSEFVYEGPVSDDGNVQIPLETGVDFYGVNYTDIFVNSNGNLTFTAGDSDFNATEAEMLSDEPRIAPMFGDMSPNISGDITVSVNRLPGGAFDSLVVTFVDVPKFGEPTSINNMSVTLAASGMIDMSWTDLDLDATTIAGISPGGDLSVANEIDLNGNATGGADLAMYEVFDNATCGEDADQLEGFAVSFIPVPGAGYDVVSMGVAAGATVSGISPDNGSELGGETITVSGANFDLLGSYSVTFGANAPVAATIVDACTLEVVAPANSNGAETVDVTVTDGGSFSVTLSGAYTYSAAGIFSGSFSLSDDGSAEHVFNTGSFTFYGVNYTSVWVNANGNLTFGTGDSDFSESESEMLSGQPRIAQAWDDHNPTVNGTITWTEDTDTFSVTFSNIPAYTTGDNTHTATINKTTGQITFSYGTCTSWNGTVNSNSVLVGISAGGSLGVSTPLMIGTPGSTTALAPDDAIFEHLNTVNPWNLDGTTMSFTPTAGVGFGPYQHNL